VLDVTSRPQQASDLVSRQPTLTRFWFGREPDRRGAVLERVPECRSQYLQVLARDRFLPTFRIRSAGFIINFGDTTVHPPGTQAENRGRQLRGSNPVSYDAADVDVDEIYNERIVAGYLRDVLFREVLREGFLSAFAVCCKDSKATDSGAVLETPGSSLGIEVETGRRAASWHLAIISRTRRSVVKCVRPIGKMTRLPRLASARNVETVTVSRNMMAHASRSVMGASSSAGAAGSVGAAGMVLESFIKTT